MRPKRRPSSREANFWRLLASYKNRAKSKNVAFTISDARFKELTKQPCIMCGAKPAARYKHDKSARYRVPYIYNGIDRLSREHGYVDGNVAACCWPCNDLKGRLSLEEFLQKIHDLYQYHFGEGE